jgi:hypothetical protein
MRARSMPMFFLLNMAIVFVAGMLGVAAEAVAFNDRVRTSAVVSGTAFAVVFATTMTVGERIRRRGEAQEQ